MAFPKQADISRTWNPEKHRVQILVPNAAGGIHRLFQHFQDELESPGTMDISFFETKSSLKWDKLRFPWRLWALYRKLLRDRVDICHINISADGSSLRKFFFAAICRAANVSYVVHLHSGRYPRFFSELPSVLRERVRSMFLRAERVIVLGTVWRDFVVDVIGVAPERAVILPNAVGGPVRLPDREEAHIPHLLFLGRLGPGKGVPEIVKALNVPAMGDRRWRATLAGDGAVGETRLAVKRAELDDRVEVPGWVGPQRVRQLLAEADILLLPSHTENLPLSMLEGMGYGLCPVVTPVGAVPDVIRDGENGVLVPVGDPRALADALCRLIDDPARRARLGAQARADFEAHYDMRNYRQKLEAIYLDVLRRT